MGRDGGGGSWAAGSGPELRVPAPQGIAGRLKAVEKAALWIRGRSTTFLLRPHR